MWRKITSVSFHRSSGISSFQLLISVGPIFGKSEAVRSIRSLRSRTISLGSLDTRWQQDWWRMHPQIRVYWLPSSRHDEPRLGGRHVHNHIQFIWVQVVYGMYCMFGVTPTRGCTWCTYGFYGVQVRALNPIWVPYSANFCEPRTSDPSAARGTASAYAYVTLGGFH